MPKITEMDDKVTLRDQLGTDVSPVVLINRFTVAPEEVDRLLKAWAADVCLALARSTSRLNALPHLEGDDAHSQKSNTHQNQSDRPSKRIGEMLGAVIPDVAEHGDHRSEQ